MMYMCDLTLVYYFLGFVVVCFLCFEVLGEDAAEPLKQKTNICHAQFYY